ncbi:MAG TPA: transcriptional regulator, partial [Alphaproteobacteria bacterium]|nr:transcriptional regulator [Alphaproteobacteria bacterium]
GILLAQPWHAVGPDGGTVRSLALDPANPERIFLGTSAGTLYLSNDSGFSWSRLSHLGGPAEMALDKIVIDPKNSDLIYVAAWNVESPLTDGDLFRSRDGGKTWQPTPDLHGKSVRALALSVSDPNTLVAGTLDGVFRSRNQGESWRRISPENHAEIKNLASIAIDPANPDIIYAGTWRLPWKTEDGGASWHSIRKGVIEDSDVFSIVVDSANPSNIYISACSGIYRSEVAGELFRKIQGIPYSARRTRVLRMDPADHSTVYAGTTEGLWKTTDAGAKWTRTTGANLVVNDVLIDPRNSKRVLLATDRSGVMVSQDGGLTFAPSNRGFSHRQVASLLVDRQDPALLYAGLLNDKEFGSVYVSPDEGLNWKQISEGLDGRDVYVLRQAPDRSVIAGTNRGLFLLAPSASAWVPLNVAPAAKSEKPRPNLDTQSAADAAMNLQVRGLELTLQRWYAATPAGLFASSDHGQSWGKVALPGIRELVGISASDHIAVAIGRGQAAVSLDQGETWLSRKGPDGEVFANCVAVDQDRVIWLGAREGVYRSADDGESWKPVSALPLSDVIAIELDEANHRMFAVGASSTNIFESRDSGRTWRPVSSGWPVRELHVAGGRIVAVTAFDGVVIQDQPERAAKSVRQVSNVEQ